MLTLHAGDSVLTVAPERGGALMGWSCGADQLLATSREVGCFPLVPYANRIAFGRFRWDGTAYRLPLNFGDHPHSIHGVGWQTPWVVAASDARSVRLVLSHDGSGGWPFPFEAAQTFALDPEALTVTLASSALQDLVGMGLFLLVLFVMPNGLFGAQRRRG